MKTTLALALVALVAAACASPQGVTAEEKRQDVLKTRDEALSTLYSAKPDAKDEIENAPGYAVFSNIGTNLIFVAAGHGYGVVTAKSGKKVYMKMGEVGAGLGLGVKDFRAIIIFETEQVMNAFIEKGWEFGGEADASAKSDEKGDAASGALSIGGMKIYQLTETGLALQVTVSGTKYWKDDELN